MIEGVLNTPLKRISGVAGDVWHAMKASWPGYAGFGEAYFSTIHEGMTKSWRRHRRATLNLIVPVGSIVFAVHDERPDSATYGVFKRHVLGATSYSRLSLPPGVWFAFRGLGPGTSILLDIADEEHDPDEIDTRDFAAIPFPEG